MPARRHRGRYLAVTVALAALTFSGGLVVGSGIVTVPGLELGDHDGRLRAQIGSLTDENEILTEKLVAAEEFQAKTAGQIVRDALAGKSVVLLRTPDADAGDLEAVSGLIGMSGGSVTGTVEVTAEFVDANSAAKLDSVVNSPILPAGTELDTTLLDGAAQAGDLIGIALLTGPDPDKPAAADSDRETVLATLRETGFIGYRDLPRPADTAVVVTGGALSEDAGNRGLSVARLAAGLSRHGSGTVLAGRTGSGGGVAAVAVAREDPAIAGAVTTVDDVDAEAGRITVVLALRDLIGGGRPGPYGVGDGASAVTVPQ